MPGHNHVGTNILGQPDDYFNVSLSLRCHLAIYLVAWCCLHEQFCLIGKVLHVYDSYCEKNCLPNICSEFVFSFFLFICSLLNYICAKDSNLNWNRQCPSGFLYTSIHLLITLFLLLWDLIHMFVCQRCHGLAMQGPLNKPIFLFRPNTIILLKFTLEQISC